MNTNQLLVLIIVGVLVVGGACTAAKTLTRSSRTVAPSSSTTALEVPDSITLTDEQACDLVTEDVVAAVGITNPIQGGARNKWGTTCSYDTAEVILFVLLTDGPAQGLAEVRPNTDYPIDRTLGPYPTRQESRKDWCNLDVELVPGRVLRINLETHAHPDPVATAETIAVHALRNLSPG